MQGSEDDASPPASTPEHSSPNQLNYSLIASKQMVGLFLSVWVKNELVPHIAHVRLSSLGRGIMGCLGNKVGFFFIC